MIYRRDQDIENTVLLLAKAYRSQITMKTINSPISHRISIEFLCPMKKMKQLYLTCRIVPENKSSGIFPRRLQADEIILLGLIFLLIEERIDDDFLLIILIYLLVSEIIEEQFRPSPKSM